MRFRLHTYILFPVKLALVLSDDDEREIVLVLGEVGQKA
jgi:hypothetical protein